MRETDRERGGVGRERGGRECRTGREVGVGIEREREGGGGQGERERRQREREKDG